MGKKEGILKKKINIRTNKWNVKIYYYSGVLHG